MLAPLRISSPASRRTGSGSPVSAASSSTARLLTSSQSDRHDLAREHEQPVARDDLAGRHVDHAAPLVAMRDRRSARGKSGELAARSPEGAVVEHLAAREHERDDETGLVLAQAERAGDREQRDDVGAELAANHAPRDRDGERRDHGEQDARPEQVRGAGAVGESQCEAAREGERDGHGDESAAHLPMLAPRAARASVASARVMRRNPHCGCAATPMAGQQGSHKLWLFP